MRSKKVSAGRGVGRTYTLLDHREAYANDFGGKSETLTLGHSVSWAKSFKRSHT